MADDTQPKAAGSDGPTTAPPPAGDQPTAADILSVMMDAAASDTPDRPQRLAALSDMAAEAAGR